MICLFRADAGPGIGAGHVMRCLALAQAWQNQGGRAVFALAGPAYGLEARLEAEGCGVQLLSAETGSASDAAETATLAERLGASWIVQDGYRFDEAYSLALRRPGLRLLVLDDNIDAPRFHADLVLNQNAHATPDMYRGRGEGVEFLLGTRYALLRREFLRHRNTRREIPDAARRLLVTLGGATPEDVLSKVLRALSVATHLPSETVVLQGGAELLAALAEGIRGVRMQHGTDDMAGLMVWADLAITAGGSTNWERGFLGLPALVLILADNQASLADSLESLGVGRNLGWAASVTETEVAAELDQLCRNAEVRTAMSRRGRELVDGFGAERVVERMRGPAVLLRPAGEGDCPIVWQWANDPHARAMSFTPEPIPWESHPPWYAKKLADPNCLFLIATDHSGTALGMVRFDIVERSATISINLAPEARGRGHGVRILRAACRRLFEENRADRIEALIRPENAPSRSIFQKAGFEESAALRVRDIPAHLFLFHR